MWRKLDPYIPEAAKIRWDTVEFTRGLGYDIGCGSEKVWPHAIGIDNRKDTGLFNIQMNPDLTVPDASDLSRLIVSGQADWVFSSHLLEHIEFENVPKALKEWWRLLRSGGYLTLYLPDEDEYPKVGEDGANPDHKWNVNYDKIIEAMKPLGSWDLVEFQKRNQDNEYSLFFVFKKV